MRGVFDGIEGQEQVTTLLQAALDHASMSHAYLLVGSQSDLLETIAERFAAACIACGDDGGLDESEFDAALRRSHPDLSVVEPESSTGYLIEQVRALVHDAGLAPVRSHHKVYILQHADRLQGAAANAFLKTLEEPPEGVICILLAASENALLETLRSRCQVLTCSQTGASVPQDCFMLNCLIKLVQGERTEDLLRYAQDCVEHSSAGLDELRAQQEEELQANADYLSQGAQHSIEERQKRERSLKQRNSLLDSIHCVKSWLRDCVMLAQGYAENVSFDEYYAVSLELANRLGVRPILQAIQIADTTCERISANVTPQLALEAMFFETKEALCPES